MHRAPHAPRGFTLVEALIALAILVTVLVGLAGLLTTSVRLARESGIRGSAVLAAQQKLEWLNARTFGYAPDGSAATDEALAPAPPDALDTDTPGYVDAIDERGREVDPGAGHVVWRRRWAITEVDLTEPGTIAVEVCVFRPMGAGATSRAAEACVSTLRTRQP